jgi:tubulin delta
MSVIFVQAGQCGNQLGFALYDTLFKHLWSKGGKGCYNSDLESFFRPNDDSADAGLAFFGKEYASSSSDYSHTSQDDSNMTKSKGSATSPSSFNIPKLRARAVCVDTEPKVVTDIYHKSMSSTHQYPWSYSSTNVLYRHGGAGNNWALGYQMLSGEFLQTILNAIKKEIEECLSPPIILIIHSTAGGTGSGLGTRLTEVLAYEFPSIPRANICIAPYGTGEVAVQHYNTLLCLAKTSNVSDAIILLENDTAYELCKSMWKLTSPSLSDINNVITSQIMPFLLPKQKYNFSSNGTYALEKDDVISSSSSTGTHTLVDDIRHLCAHPSYKFLDVYCVPQTMKSAVEFTYDKWESLGKSLQRLLYSNMKCETTLASFKGYQEHDMAVFRMKSDSSSGSTTSLRSEGSHLNSLTAPPQNIATSLTYRGIDANADIAAQAAYDTALNISDTSHQYSPLIYEPVQTYYSLHCVENYQRSASVLANGQGCLPILKRAITGATQTYRVGAYLHQYENYGMEREDIVECFRRLGQSVIDYESIGPPN